MKYLFVGDIHGRLAIMEHVDIAYPNHHKVFLGDYVDSYELPRIDQVRCIEKCIDMVERGVATCLWGNHDLQYVFPRMRCAGYYAETDILLMTLKEKMVKLFAYYLYLPGEVLVTHAGLTLRLVDDLHIDTDRLGETLNRWKEMRFTDGRNPNGWVGYARFGARPYGGIFWCDFNAEFVPVPGLNQVFGHTNLIDDRRYNTEPPGIRTRGANNYCLDCLDRAVQFLEYDTETKLFAVIQENTILPMEN